MGQSLGLFGWASHWAYLDGPVSVLTCSALVVSDASGASTPPKRSLLDGPPPEYNFRASTAEATRAVVSKEYPQLLPLVDRGAHLYVLFVRLQNSLRHAEDL